MTEPMTPDGRPATLDERQLEMLQGVPSGAAVLSAVAVLLLLIAWLMIYLLVYLPRGMVG